MPSPIYKGPTNALVQQPDSPVFEFGDRVKQTNTWRGVQSVCTGAMLARGTFGTGAFAGLVVNRCTMNTERGGLGRLVIEWEAGGAGAPYPLPAGDFHLDPQELYPKVERNKFFYSGGVYVPTANTVALAYATVHASTPYARANAATQLAGLSDATQRSLGQALAAKLQRGEETYYLAGWRYTYFFFSYTLPAINIGGSIQSPNGIGPVSISDSTISWLRLADSVENAGCSGSMWKITRTWLGGPGGYWDADLYP